MTSRKSTVTFAVALVAMVAAIVLLQVVRDRTFAVTSTADEMLYIRSGKIMEKAALSYDALLADVYWIRALQHYGRERLKPAHERKYQLLYPLLDLATTLDPRFTIAYRFGAIFLAEPHPGGAGSPDQAIALLKNGIARHPEKWDYYHDVGFIYYWNLHDYQQAAEWFSRGGDLPGAPWWLRTYAAVMLTRGGDRQASRAMWVHIGQSEEGEWLKKTSQLRLQQLDALDQIDVLNRLSAEFKRRTGQAARSWEQLIAAGLVRGVPTDPSGTPYRIDPQTGEFGVAADSQLWPLPTEPAAAPELKSATPPVPPVRP
jgi:tetratricopeptide (TPR) repeat protein